MVYTPQRVILKWSKQGRWTDWTRGTYIMNRSAYRIFGEFTKFRKAAIRFAMPFCPSGRPSERNNSAPNVRIFMNFDI
jgi:hypothetical protein